MGNLQSGGGTSAVAASAHAGCRRFRPTDSFLTRKTRKALAAHVESPDTTAGIPEARWMRAMTFERRVHDDQFVSELLTKTVGQLDLPRPAAVARVTCNGSVEVTAKALKDADLKATFADTATMISALGIPYLFLENESATAVSPDFAIVAPRRDGPKVTGSWLSWATPRLRTRPGPHRRRAHAEGAPSGCPWRRVCRGVEPAAERHTGAPLRRARCTAQAFLQPEAVVEQLDDHRAEVRGRALERLEEKRKLGDNHPTDEELPAYVAHLEATFDPATCVSCSLFGYCRSELRASHHEADVLVEIGVPPRYRPGVTRIVEGSNSRSDPGADRRSGSGDCRWAGVWQRRGRSTRSVCPARSTSRREIRFGCARDPRHFGAPGRCSMGDAHVPRAPGTDHAQGRYGADRRSDHRRPR